MASRYSNNLSPPLLRPISLIVPKNTRNLFWGLEPSGRGDAAAHRSYPPAK
jgi:hypothetical protein